MREWIIKAVKNRDAVNVILAGIDADKLSSGQILITPSILGAVLKIVSDGKFEFSNLAMEGGGVVSLDIKTKSVYEKSHKLRIIISVPSITEKVMIGKRKDEYEPEKNDTALYSKGAAV